MSEELTLEKEVTKLEKTLIKDGRKDFVEEIRNLEEDALNNRLLGLAKHRQEIENSKNADEELSKARLNKSTLEAPYREQKKMNDKLARFISLVMKDKGIE